MLTVNTIPKYCSIYNFLVHNLASVLPVLKNTKTPKKFFHLFVFISEFFGNTDWNSNKNTACFIYIIYFQISTFKIFVCDEFTLLFNFKTAQLLSICFFQMLSTINQQTSKMLLNLFSTAIYFIHSNQNASCSIFFYKSCFIQLSKIMRNKSRHFFAIIQVFCSFII